MNINCLKGQVANCVCKMCWFENTNQVLPNAMCQCNNAEHDEYNEECPHNQPMDYVMFLRTISEGFSLDGAQRWSDLDIFNFMLEDEAVADYLMKCLIKRFNSYCKDFTIDDILNWESIFIHKPKQNIASFLIGSSPIPPYDPQYKGD